jgi:hypothetical protein
MKKLKLYLLSFTLIIVIFFLTIDLYFVYLDFSGQNEKANYISKVIMSKIGGSYKNEQ